MGANGNTPVTCADRDRWEKRMVEVLDRMDKRMDERLHDTETKLLRAFFQYQEHAAVPMRKMSADISNMDTARDLRLNNLERRVIEVERRTSKSAGSVV